MGLMDVGMLEMLDLRSERTRRWLRTDLLMNNLCEIMARHHAENLAKVVMQEAME